MTYDLEQHAAYRAVATALAPLDYRQALTASGFPRDLWRNMVEEGLLDFLPGADPRPENRSLANHSLLNRSLLNWSLLNRSLQNEGAPSPARSWQALAIAGYALTRLTHSPGLTTSWLGQQLALHFLTQTSASPAALACSSALRSGRALCAIAISEPGVGAHPKHLTTTATAIGDNFRLNGHKTFITHGPYADWFIVLAITAHTGERRHYSAFMVPRDAPGVSISPMTDVTGLHPIAHGDMTLANCLVPGSSLLGEPGRAFETISNPLRSLEDGLMLCPLAGALQSQIDLLSSHTTAPDNEILGTAMCLADSAARLGIMAAELLDRHDHFADLTTLIVGARTLITRAQGLLSEAWRDCPPAKALGDDIRLLINIGRKATANRVSALVKQHQAPPD